MVIKFTCQHCRKPLKVPDRLAGREGPCPSCKKPVKVPATSIQSAPARQPAATAQSTEPARSKEEIEQLAADALADEPVEEDSTETTITLECPFCIEEVTFDIEFGGRNAPCPECKRIIKVPMPEKKKAENWRDVNTGVPSGAKEAQIEVPDDVQGGRAKGVSQQALLEMQEKADAKAARIKLIAYGSGAAALVGILIVGTFLLLGSSSQAAAINQTLDSVTEESIAEKKMTTDQVGIVHYGAGKFFLQSKEMPSTWGAKENRCARDQFDASRSYAAGRVPGTKASRGRTNELPFFMIELAQAQLAMGGSDPQAIRQRLKLAWGEAASDAGKSLQEITDAPEWKLEGVRSLVSPLIRNGEQQTARALAGQVLPQESLDLGPGVPVPAPLTNHGIEAVATIGLEMIRAGKTEQARLLLLDLAQIYPDPEKVTKPKLPPLSMSLVAMADYFNLRVKPMDEKPRDKDPDKKKEFSLEPFFEKFVKPEEKDVVLGGIAVAEVLKGKPPATLDQVTDAFVRLEALTLIAEMKPEAGTLKAALNQLAELQQQKADVPRTGSWRLLQIGLRTNADEATMKKIIQNSPNAQVRAWSQLHHLRHQWASSKAKVDANVLDPLGKKRFAYDFGLMELARHNQAIGEDPEDMVDGWSENQRPLGLAGIALGMTEE